MCRTEGKTKLYVSPLSLVLLGAFILISSPLMLCAVLQAAVLHELGHWLTLSLYGARPAELRITAFGAEMLLDSRCRMSYGAELAAVAAGPLVNLLFAVLLGAAGRYWEADTLYLFSGAHLVLGLFNLLPAAALDGGRMLWLAVSYLIQPYAADRVCAVAGAAVSALLIAGGAVMLVRGGHCFLLLAALGLSFPSVRELGLVKRRHGG